LQQRFSVLSRKFDVVDPSGSLTMSVYSPFLKIWTFPFTKNGAAVACIRKQWSGLQEAFLDADNFEVEFNAELGLNDRLLIVAAAVFVDLRYFERKAQSNG